MISFPGYDRQIFNIQLESDPTKRDKNYYLANMQYLYSQYVRGATTIGFTGVGRLELLQAFAEGRQPHTFHKETDPQKKESPILDLNGNPVKYEDMDYPVFNWNAPIWDILSPANKIMNTLDGKLAQIDFEVSADPLDYATQHEQEQNMLDRWVYAKHKDKIQLAAGLAGVEVPEPDFVPQTPTELETMAREFLPEHVKYIEQLVKHTADISKWDEKIASKVRRDLIMWGKSCVKNDYDPEQGKVVHTYVSPKRGDVQRSEELDFSDAHRAFHFYVINISQARQLFPQQPESWFKSIAGNYCSYFGNPASITDYMKQDVYGRWLYDPFKVCVMCGEWIDINRSKQVVSTDKGGRRNVKEVSMDKRVAKDKDVRFSETQIRHECRWIVGAGEEGVFQYGPAYDITYPTKVDTELTYKWIQIPGKCITEQLIPLYKNFQDCWEKWQQLLRNMQGLGHEIDVDQIASAQGKSSNPGEAAKRAFQQFLHTDKIFVRRVGVSGIPNTNAKRAIETIDGGMGSAAADIQSAMKSNIELVEYITGINPMLTGQSADPSAPVTTQQMAYQSSVTALSPIILGYSRMRQALAENFARWAVILIRGNSYAREQYSAVIGKDGVKAVIAANKSEAQYGIKMNPRPTEVERQWMLQQLSVATTPNATGGREISIADGFRILNMLSSNSPMKTVEDNFERAIEKQRKAQMADKQALITAQEQANDRNAQNAGQIAEATATKQHEFDLALQAEKNKGLVGNTAIQEEMRKNKEVEVANIKTQPAAVA